MNVNLLSPPPADLIENLMERRTLYLVGDLEEDNAAEIIARMLILSRTEGDINLIIQSWGGSLADTLAIYDVMKSIPNDVATYALGKATSAGAFLLAAGTKGKRYAYPSARIMMHQPQVFYGHGDVTDHEISVNNDKAWKRLFLERFARSVGKDVKKVMRDFERDRWFSAEEALEYGIIDHIVELKED